MKVQFNDGYGITDGELLQVQGQHALITTTTGGLDCGTTWHPVSGIQNSAKVLLDFQLEQATGKTPASKLALDRQLADAVGPRKCTWGSGRGWADCPAGSQYCG